MDLYRGWEPDESASNELTNTTASRELLDCKAGGRNKSGMSLHLTATRQRAMPIPNILLTDCLFRIIIKMSPTRFAWKKSVTTSETHNSS
jgi:hypothetical protein